MGKVSGVSLRKDVDATFLVTNRAATDVGLAGRTLDRETVAAFSKEVLSEIVGKIQSLEMSLSSCVDGE